MGHKPVVLITGASGEMGHGLVSALAVAHDVVAMDLKPCEPELAKLCSQTLVGDILDRGSLARVFAEHDVHAVFHLAALLSTRSEASPELAHQVNVTGTLNLLELSAERAARTGQMVKFLFPSSIAAYGVPTLDDKRRAGKVDEDQCLNPTTMYGCNKLYCEHLGRYYTNHYKQLSTQRGGSGVDFRAIRFPGLVSAFTVPSGGTSDYGPEMLHAAAKGEAYDCFVREDARIPFMAMPDAIDALLGLMAARRERLSTHVYNIAAFNPSAGEFAELVRAAFPSARIRFVPDVRRQGIVDSWPEDVDDSRARRDWGFQNAYDLRRAMDEYLLPNIKKRYGLG